MKLIKHFSKHQTEVDPISNICMEISQLMEDSNANVNDFICAIRFNPELCSTILKIANNAYAGFCGEIKSLPKAVMMIGIGQLHYIINSIHDSPELKARLNEMPDITAVIDELSENKQAS
ncbi:MAG: HDOD domain-containing protein [Gammaproteobacteria bacterium]|nr:HDOD domain-containing protein [Gammaproteobacteria bacterium]